MAHPTIRLFEPPPAGDAPFRFDGEPEGLEPRPLADIEADIEAAVEAGAPWIVLGHHEPTAHPQLKEILWKVDDLEARAKATSNGVRLAESMVLETLRDGGLAQLTLVFWGGDAATHDARVGQEGAWAKAMEALDIASSLNSLLITTRYVLMADNHEQVGAFVASSRAWANRLELVRLSALTRDVPLLKAHGVRRKHALRAVQAAWEAARVTHLKMYTVGFGTYPAAPRPRQTPVQPADLTLLDLLRSNVPVPAASNGTWATPSTGDVTGIWNAVDAAGSLHELGLQLAAYGCPPLDLPPQLGGVGLDVKPGEEDDEDVLPLKRKDGLPRLLHRILDEHDTRPLPTWEGPGRDARVAVIAGHLTDNILALSTLPALVEAMKGLGADATLHTVWDAPLNPYDNGIRLADPQPLEDAPDLGPAGLRYPEAVVEALSNLPARIAHAAKRTPRFLADLDLSDHDLVVVPGFDNALAVVDNPTLPDHARVVVADFHLMTGLGGWHQRWLEPGTRSMDGTWWPDERIVVHALYPRSVRAYWRAGVPTRQIHWRPYPIHTGHFRPGPPPAKAAHRFAGGNHQRDYDTLAQAARLLGPTGASRWRIHTTEAVPAPLSNDDEVRLLHFYEALANSRYVVLPLHPDHRRPAGISVISLAMAAGRPVIATATSATLDHLHDGHNALLVPPGRPKSLARAIRALDTDEDLLNRLAAGARHTARHLSVDAWATTLLDGAPPRASWWQGEVPKGPFRPWPG